MSDLPNPNTPPPLDIYRRHQLDAIAARWDARATGWDRDLENPACHLNEDDAYPRFLREVRRLIETRRDFCARHGVLDAGCGTGLVLADVAAAFAWGIGLDVSAAMIRQAQQKHPPHTRFVVGDCFQLAALCPPAGAVLSRGVLLSHYGTEEGRKLLGAAKDALVPGGFLAFDFLNQAARHHHAHQPENKTYFTADEACHLAAAAGLARIRVVGGETRRVGLLCAERG